jgi:hypothetical protein
MGAPVVAVPLVPRPGPADHRLHVTGIAVLLGITAVCTAIAVITFRRRDLAA